MMQLDPLTLMVPAVIASAVASIFVFGAWFQFRDAPALIWWGAAHAAHAIGLAIITAGIATGNPDLTPAGGALLSLSPILLWAGLRRFFDLRAPWPVLVGMPALLPLLAIVSFGPDGEMWPIAVGFMFWPLFLAAGSWLLVRKRAERLPARWPFVAILTIQGTVYSIAVFEAVTGQFPLDAPPSLSSPFGIVHFETILFSMGAAFLMILICRERHELYVVEAASIDPLTGASNRNAFFETAERIKQRDRREGAPCSLIMFDLDRFKAINDDYGHQFGDRILSGFAATVRQSLRPRDLFGRYGGEEFLVILPGTSVQTAKAITERIRQAFAEGHAFVDGKPVKATVSGGVAGSDGKQSLEDLIRAADEAMYMAKRNGRNRVEVASGNSSDDKVVRIA